MAGRTKSNEMNIIILDSTQTLLNEISNKALSKKDIALTYALAIMSKTHTDFKKVNEAITKRWSMTELINIKEQAWKNVEIKSQP